MTDGPRFPFDPLERLILEKIGRVGPAWATLNGSEGHQRVRRQYLEGWTADAERRPLSAIAEILGVTLEEVRKFRERGLGPFAADRLAIAAGFHPSSVWPAWDEWKPDDLTHGQLYDRNRRRVRRGLPPVSA